jgi:hypothetical protein
MVKFILNVNLTDWHPTVDLLKKRKKEDSHFQEKEDSG